MNKIISAFYYIFRLPVIERIRVISRFFIKISFFILQKMASLNNDILGYLFAYDRKEDLVIANEIQSLKL